MRKLFIDANIYLGFYNSNAQEFKKLLRALTELSGKIFITQQVVDEVSRNKVQVFKLSMEGYIREAALKATFLPEHLDAVEDAKLKAWNGQRKALQQAVQTSNQQLQATLKEVLARIAVSEDAVSKELLPVFEKAVAPSEQAFQKAVHRKTIGNPPGKPGDPLGDQLSWEQLLEDCKGVTEMYIVTNDGDYATIYDDLALLNPVLYNDIRRVNPTINVFIFNKLSAALTAFNKAETIASLPSEKDMQLIVREEPEVYLPKHHFTVYGGGTAVPTRCPKCGSENSFLDIGWQRSQIGGLTQQYLCMNCKFTYDTGDSWD